VTGKRARGRPRVSRMVEGKARQWSAPLLSFTSNGTGVQKVIGRLYYTPGQDNNALCFFHRRKRVTEQVRLCQTSITQCPSETK